MKHSGSLPYAFTEHGVAMLASVLKSERAVKISIRAQGGVGPRNPSDLQGK